MPETVQYRSIRYRITGRTEVLTIVTTLLDSKQYSAEDIAELYGLRWDVGTDIACWKTTMGYCDLRCHTPENLDREIAVGVLAYNLVRSLMNDAAAVLEVHPREIKKRNQSKYPKMKKPRPSRARRIEAEAVKPSALDTEKCLQKSFTRLRARFRRMSLILPARKEWFAYLAYQPDS